MLKKFVSKVIEVASKLTNFLPIQPSSKISQYIMSKDEAMKILNIKTDKDLNIKKITEQADLYIKINDPYKGGSFYIQNKVHHAKTCLLPLCEFNHVNKQEKNDNIYSKLKKEKKNLDNKI